MNTFFYLAIDRVDLGKAVTIEFIGPITVAAVATRSLRNAVALLFAIAGVVVLGQGEIDGNALGLLFILLASAMWAVYIVVGSKVAQLDRGVAGLGHRAGDRIARDDPGRRTVERAGVGVAVVARRLPAGRRVLQRDRLRHRPVRDAPDPDPPVLRAPGAAARHRAGGRMDRARSATFRHRVARRRPGARRRGHPGTRGARPPTTAPRSNARSSPSRPDPPKCEFSMRKTALSAHTSGFNGRTGGGHGATRCRASGRSCRGGSRRSWR